MCKLCKAPGTTTTTTGAFCVDKDTCPSKLGTCDCADKCNNPIVGDILKRDCPVMCCLCGNAPHCGPPTTTTTTTTLTTTTIVLPPSCAFRQDDPSCPTQ